MATRLNTITETEVEVYTENDYIEMLDEVHGDFMGYPASQILEEVDPTAYRVGFNDFQEYKTVYTCDCCETEYDDEDSALDCCESWECDCCSGEHTCEYDADECCSDED